MYEIQQTTDQAAFDALVERGRNALAGGVCSSTRFNQAWGGPVYASRAKGSRFVDIQGREFLDMSMSHGATLLGHAPECLKTVLERSWELGLLCSLDTPLHIELAEILCRLVPSAERVRFTGSGSEATLHALRLCRAATGKEKILRFYGHFHGYHELTYIGGHPPADQIGAQPPYRESAGIPLAMAELIVAAEYNDIEALERIVREQHEEIGTILIEPVDFNCGCILPQPGFLEKARELADEYGLILFFDEIQSFAKQSSGGAQKDFGVTPDICTIGKSLGAGMPLSAICGRADLMEGFKPTGAVAHSGTFNAPLPSILGGLAFVEQIQQPAFWEKIGMLGGQLEAGLEDIAARSPVPVRFQQHGSRFGIIFGTREPVTCYSESLCHDKQVMIEFCRQTTARGVYFHDYSGGACHHGYSLAHTPEEIDQVLNVMDDSLQAMG